MRSSSARVRATSRYISTRSASLSPTVEPSLETVRSLTALRSGDRLAWGSEVERPPVDGHRGLAEHLGQRGMGMRRGADLPGRRLEREGERRLGNEVGDVGADEVDAEYPLGLHVRDDLDEPL